MVVALHSLGFLDSETRFLRLSALKTSDGRLLPHGTRLTSCLGDVL